jgi:hypothetical protein
VFVEAALSGGLDNSPGVAPQDDYRAVEALLLPDEAAVTSERCVSSARARRAAAWLAGGSHR